MSDGTVTPRANPASETGRCPRCGDGSLVDISFDLDPADAAADGMQEAESRQVETYSCGHTVVGPRLSSADQEAMVVERRTSDETTMPPPDGASDDPSPTSPGAPVPASPEDAERLVEEASEDSFPASDPPSYWARDDDEPSPA